MTGWPVARFPFPNTILSWVIFIATAAVSDYCACEVAGQKIKKTSDTMTLSLTRTPDVLATESKLPNAPFVVGFAAETNDVAANARAKLEAKGIDLLVANDVSQAGIGFDADDNEVLLIDRWGGNRALPRMPKSAVADSILTEILTLRRAAGRVAGKAPR